MQLRRSTGELGEWRNWYQYDQLSCLSGIQSMVRNLGRKARGEPALPVRDQTCWGTTVQSFWFAYLRQYTDEFPFQDGRNGALPYLAQFQCANTADGCATGPSVLSFDGECTTVRIVAVRCDGVLRAAVGKANAVTRASPAAPPAGVRVCKNEHIAAACDAESVPFVISQLFAYNGTAPAATGPPGSLVV